MENPQILINSNSEAVINELVASLRGYEGADIVLNYPVVKEQIEHVFKTAHSIDETVHSIDERSIYSKLVSGIALCTHVHTHILIR